MDLEDAVAILKDEVGHKCSAYADRALAEVLPLVEEKFTSTNSKSMPLTPQVVLILHAYIIKPTVVAS